MDVPFYLYAANYSVILDRLSFFQTFLTTMLPIH